MYWILYLLSLIPYSLSLDTNVEKLPSDPCDCRDWYGMCKKKGEKWTDDDTWIYQCTATDASDAPLIGCLPAFPPLKMIPIGMNKTIGSLWHSCMADQQKVKYESEAFCRVNDTMRRVGEEFRDGRFQWLCLSTGRWVVGCYYKNETNADVYLKIGESGYNGLIKHVCDRYEDYPGRVQYYAEVRNDVHVKHPTNKGINKNFQEPADLRIKEKVDRWLHEVASIFIANDEPLRAKVRYLPASRRQWPVDSE